MKGDAELARLKPDGTSCAHRGAQPADEGYDTTSPEQTDVVVVRGVTTAGDGLEVIRQRGNSLEAGVIQRIEHGKPIHGEVVRLKPRPECPLICDVKVELPASKPAQQDVAGARPAAPARGPAKVASQRYRDNWDLIWKRPQPDDRPN